MAQPDIELQLILKTCPTTSGDEELVISGEVGAGLPQAYNAKAAIHKNLNLFSIAGILP